MTSPLRLRRDYGEDRVANPIAFLKAVKEVVSSIRHLGLKINYDEWGSDRSPDNIFLSFKVSVVGVANLSLDFQWSAQAQTAQVTEGKKTLFTAHKLEDFPLILNLMPTSTKTSKFASSSQMFPHLFSLTNVDNDLLMKAISCVSSAPERSMSRRELAIKLSDALGDLEVKGSLSLVDVVLKDLNDLKKKDLVKVAARLNDDSFESLFNNPPDKISLPWGSPAKPNMWKTKRIKYPALTSFTVLAYSIESPALSEPLTLYLRDGENKVTNSPNVKIKLYDSKDVILYSKIFEPSNLYTVSKLLSHIWDYLNETPYFKRSYITISKVASSGVNDVSALEYLETNPSSLSLPWGTPPKPNLWKAEYQGGSRFVVTSPVLSTDYSYILVFSKAHSVIEFVAFDKDGMTRNIYRKQWHNNDWAKRSLNDILDQFWFSISRGKEPLIKKYLRVDKVASLQDTYAKDILDTLPEVLTLPWGSPPKPNLWKTTRHTKWEWTVESPVLDPKFNYILEIKPKYRGKEREWGFTFLASSNGFQRIIFYKQWDKSQIDLYTLNDLLQKFWDEEMRFEGDKIKKYLRVDKVASDSNIFTVMDIVRQKPDTFDLWWGDPPKPNVWKVSLAHKSITHLKYNIISPLLNDVTVTSLDLVFEHDINKNTITIEVWSPRLSRCFYSSVRSISELERITPTEFTSYIWRNLTKRLSRHDRALVFKPNVKVASTARPSVADIVEGKPKTLELAWGDPPKKNLWKVELLKTGSSEHYREWVAYKVTSPVLLKPLFLSWAVRDEGQKFNVEFNVKEEGAHATNIEGLSLRGDFGPNAYYEPFDNIMEELWFVIKTKSRMKKILKPNVKVASTSTSVADVIEHKPETLELAWGTPPKKNLWKASLDVFHPIPTGEYIQYKVNSPVLLKPLSLSFTVRGFGPKEYIEVNVRDDMGSMATYSLMRQDISSYREPLDKLMRFIFLLMSNSPLGGLSRFIKPNLKVASALSHIRDRQTYGLRSLSSPSSQTGLFFYPVRQHRSKRATRHAFYLNDTELNIMEWQGSEWSKMSSVTLRRQQSELLLRLLRTIASTVEKM